jgi:hypothetical protein
MHLTFFHFNITLLQTVLFKYQPRYSFFCSHWLSMSHLTHNGNFSTGSPVVTFKL